MPHRAMNTASLTGSMNLDGTPVEAKLDQDYKRDVDHRRKYALGTVDLGPRVVPALPVKQRYAHRRLS